MKTIQNTDKMTQIAERDMQGVYEKFKQETTELVRKQREAKERKDRETGKPAESADK